MATTTARMQQRRDSSADWAAVDPVLLDGELGYDTDEKRFKIGDGETPWTSLDFLLDAELEAAQDAADAAAASAAEAEATLASAEAGLAAKLAKASNLSDLPSAATARTNLGLGDTATKSVGTGAGTVAAGDDSRITGAAQKSQNLSDLASPATARTNLGLGDSATKAVGTTAGTVAAGDDSRVVGAAQKSANLSDLGSAATSRTNLGLGDAATKGVASSAETLAGTEADKVVTPAGYKAVRAQIVEDILGQAMLERWGVLADGREIVGSGGMTSGSATLSLPTVFTTADVGKLIAVEGAGAAGGTLISTIIARIDNTHVTLADSAATTIATATVAWGTDDGAAFQAMLDNVIRGRGVSVAIGTSRAICFKDQLIVTGDARVVGNSSNHAQRNNSPTGGSDLWWFGASGTDAVVTAIDAESDWSRGELRNLRITNRAKSNAAGWGLFVRNAQNSAELFNVTVIGFPDGQCKVRETKTTPLGAYPGFFFIDRCFFIGGKVPLSLAQGSQPVAVTRSACDTDAKTDVAGVELIPGPIPSAGPRGPVSFRDFKVEIATTTLVDIPAVKITSDQPVEFASCEWQDNRDATRRAALGLAGSINTKGGIEHTNATRKWARIVMTNVSNWNMTYSLRLLSAGFDLPNPGTTAPWACSWHWEHGDIVTLLFTHETIVTSMASDNAGLGGSGSGAGAVSRIPFDCPGVIVGMAASLASPCSAGTLAVKLVKNAANFVHQLQFSTTAGSTVRLAANLTKIDLDAQGPTYQVFAEGDQYGVSIDSSGTFAPTASQKVTIMVRARLYQAGR